MIYNLIFLTFLFLLSAFFSGAESAFMSVNRVKIRELSNSGDIKAALVDRMLGEQTKLLSTILIGNNLVNIAASAISTSIAITLYGNTGIGIATGIVTIIVLIFGEITPKTLGSKKAISFSKFASLYLIWIEKLLFPVIFVFTWFINKFIGKNNFSSTFLSEEEIRRFVNVSEEEGVINKSEREMINSIFEFDDTIVREVMVPRIDMVCIDENASITELVKSAVKHGHSRIPVFSKTIDNIIGLIYVKDLLNIFINNKRTEELKEFIKNVYFIPESKKISQLLTEMKKRREHMAIVLDEYGGTAGLITIEDLIEEILGDIQDEYDLEPKQIEIINDRELLVDGRVDIQEINDFLEEPLAEMEDYETIGGLVLHYLGYLPSEGDRLELDSIDIEIKKCSEHRIKKLKLLIKDTFKKR